MKPYDIVFIGQLGTGTIIPFEGSPFIEQASPVLFAAIAASCLGKKTAAVTRVPEGEEYLLGPLKTAGVDLFVERGEIVQYRVVFKTADIDQRQPFLIKGAKQFVIDDIPPFEPCLMHLCCVGAPQSQLELMRGLRARGFRLSVDMQGFVLQPDSETGALHPKDVHEKKEILSIADFVKVDALEAKVLTGADALQEQANILEGWGSAETIITSSQGALVQRTGKATFAKFTNASTRGRMGRGDTLIGSYLLHRLDHSVEDSLQFAAALTSIKIESPGPFRGSLDDVLERMGKSPLGEISAGDQKR
jgi:sugar/nucleoside kinase (ribokinase family)